MKFGWFYVLAVLVTLPLWVRWIRRDRQLVLLYIGALLGAMIGGKLCYLSVEGWSDWSQPDRLVRLLSGKSILGALLFGFVTVELLKRLHGIRRVTGDYFALVVPMGIAIGRVGCVVNGCCPGADGWPAAQVELGFNALFAGLALAGRRHLWRGQWFHVYLVAYGLFRFGHEFLRDTPRCCLGISGYQIWALVLVGLGVLAYLARRADPAASDEERRRSQ